MMTKTQQNTFSYIALACAVLVCASVGAYAYVADASSSSSSSTSVVVVSGNTTSTQHTNTSSGAGTSAGASSGGSSSSSSSSSGAVVVGGSTTTHTTQDTNTTHTATGSGASAGNGASSSSSSSAAVGCGAAGASSGAASGSGGSSSSSSSSAVVSGSCDTDPTPPTPPTPGTASCTISISPSSIAQGGSATVTWASTNAATRTWTSGTITNTAVNGSQTVSPSGTTTYTMQVRNSDGSSTASCSGTLVVTGTPVAPTCSLSVTPATIQTGSSATVSWNSSNATSVTWLSGGLTSTALSGTQTVSPSGTTTYSARFTGAGGSVTCSDTVTVTDTPPAPTCTMTASPSSIAPGNSGTVSWSSENATTATFTGGINSTATTGSQTFTFANTGTYTYTGTFTGNGGSVSCSTTVTVTTNPSAPTCSLSVSPSRIDRGENATVTWSSNNTNAIQWTSGGLSSTVLSGNVGVSPSSDTTYTAVFTGTNGTTVTCSDTLDVSSGGGGGGGGRGGCLNCDDDDDDDDDRDREEEDDEPRIVLSSTFSRLPGSITLSQLPYTGFAATPLMSVLFWTFVFAVSVVIAYMITVYRPFRALGNTLRVAYATPTARSRSTYYDTVQYTPETTHDSSYGYARETADVASAAPTARAVSEDERESVETVAHAVKILLSPDAIAMITDAAKRAGTPLAEYARTVVSLVEREFARDDGWILLSKQRAQNFFAKYADVLGVEQHNTNDDAVTQDVVRERVEDARADAAAAPVEEIYPLPTASPAPAFREAYEKRSAAGSALPHVEQQHGHIESPHDRVSLQAFLRALLRGDTEALLRLPRTLHESGQSIEQFVTDAVAALDAVHVQRTEGGPLDARAAQAAQEVAALTSEQIEQVVSALVSAIDRRYSDPRIGFKIAVTKLAGIRD
jgi:hypothetical protein